MAKSTRWIAIIASLVIGCAAHAATTTKPAIHRAHEHHTHARKPQASYRTVRYARQTASHSAKTSHASTTKTTKTHHPIHSTRHRRYARRRTYHHKVRLPSGPTPERITEIQTALARGGYYSGDPSGKWDADTVAAVQKFQSAHNIDATGKLDAPTLQKLGLGSDIAGVAAPKTVIPKVCCSAPGATPAPAVAAKPAAPPASASTPSASALPAAGHAQPVAATGTTAPNSPGAGASSTASIAPAAPSGAGTPASSSKPTDQH